MLTIHKSEERDPILGHSPWIETCANWHGTKYTNLLHKYENIIVFFANILFPSM